MKTLGELKINIRVKGGSEEHPFTTHPYHLCIPAYGTPEFGAEDWLPCPNCGLRPKVWSFNNGRSTACGCGYDDYRHFSIHAESILSVVKRSNGSARDYDFDALRKNWNHWCETGEILFEHASKRNDGRW